MTVVVVGDLVTDIVVVHSGPIAVGSDTAAQISLTGGGSAANTAAWLVAAGVPAVLVAVAGQDVAGDDRIAELTAAGVDCVHIRRSPDRPTGSIVVLAQARERSFLCDRGANHLLLPSDVDRALAGARHLHLSGYTLFDPASAVAGRHALAVAKARGLTTSVDAASAAPIGRMGGPAFLDQVRGADLLLANLDEARALLDRAAEPVVLAEALAGHVGQVVVKLGADGAVWAGGGSVAVTPAVPAPVVVDPIGAGDAFAAGLLAAWLGGAPVARRLEAGARLGALAVGVAGGRPPTPRR